MGDGERKPYVRYSISAAIEDKGIAYATKQAINTFLTTHGFDGHIADFQASSDTFTAVLALYDNGKYDFNVNALYEHLESSGRLPTKKELKPKILIKPVACDIPLSVERPDYTPYEKTIADLHRQAKEREESLKRLTELLKERQQALGEATGRIETLEKRLQDAEPRQFETPKKALMGSYLKQGLALLLDIQCDVQELRESGNFDRFIVAHRRPMNLPLYLNEFYNLPITDEREFRNWDAEMKKYAGWEDTEVFKRSQERNRRFEADKNVLKTAEESGASPEIIAVLKKTLSNQAQHEKDEAEVETVKRKFFEMKKAVHERLEVITRDYESLRKVRESSEQRRDRGTYLPILVQIQGNNQPGMTFTLPLLDKDSEYEKRLVASCVQASRGEGVASTNTWVDGPSYNWSISFLPETNEEDLAEASIDIIQKLLNESLTRALGVKLKLVSLREFEPPLNPK